MAKIDPSDLYMISYTSGTTGQPKGAMATHKSVICTAMMERMNPLMTGPPVYLSYLPMAHVYERIMVIFCVVRQGKIGIYNGDVLKLTEDLAILKPTVFASVPRLFNKFYQKINAKFADGSFVARTLVKSALSTKLANLEEDGSYTHWLYDKLVFSKVKMILGGNVQVMVSGSAPIADDVVKFFKVCMGVPLLEGYGQTEAQGLEFVQDPRDWMSGNVGGITTSMELKLIDVPEMSYSVLDKDENGNPVPRGEV
jgi:long-chain acyl-CoA synthetase